MYLSRRGAQVRNAAIALVNGAVTLVILLIAPLGLMAVVVNTGLVVITTYVTATVGDQVLRYLQADTPLRGDLMDPVNSSEQLQVSRRVDQSSGIERRE
jgi:hypothetical protein